MKILIDANIFIPLEPAGGSFNEKETSVVADFLRLANEHKVDIFVHPLISNDLKNDKNKLRNAARCSLLKKYRKLPDPPTLSKQLIQVIGDANKNSNDWVDNNLLSAVFNHAVHKLITEDNDIHRKADLLNIGDRVERAAEALSWLSDLYEEIPTPPPAVKFVKAHYLNDKDEIFTSFRGSYPGFDNWLIKCKNEHRNCYVIEDDEKNRVIAFCILKPEDSCEYGIHGKILKICSFKVSEEYSKNRYGELLLKSIFDFAQANKYDFLYLTVFPELVPLIKFMEQFGFVCSGKNTNLGERVLIKKQIYREADIQGVTPLEFNRLYGPWKTKYENNGLFVIPIRKIYHSVLFPEYEDQRLLFVKDYRPCGNSIRKAYLSHSKIQQIKPGDNLMFYSSGIVKGLTAVGIVEDTKRSSDPNEIAAYVGTRTVYKFKDIVEMCKKEVLAIRFRRVHFIKPPLLYNDLEKSKTLNGPPQSIQSLRKDKLKWLLKKITPQY